MDEGQRALPPLLQELIAVSESQEYDPEKAFVNRDTLENFLALVQTDAQAIYKKFYSRIRKSGKTSVSLKTDSDPVTIGFCNIISVTEGSRKDFKASKKAKKDIIRPSANIKIDIVTPEGASINPSPTGFTDHPEEAKTIFEDPSPKIFCGLLIKKAGKPQKPDPTTSRKKTIDTDEGGPDEEDDLDDIKVDDILKTPEPSRKPEEKTDQVLFTNMKGSWFIVSKAGNVLLA